MNSTVPHKRKKLLTAFLIFAIMVDVALIISYLGFPERILAANPLTKPWLLTAMASICCLKIVCVVALLKWKRWGFWGLCILTVVTCLLNMTWITGVTAFLGLIWPVILFALLQYGKDQKAWPKLR